MMQLFGDLKQYGLLFLFLDWLAGCWQLLFASVWKTLMALLLLLLVYRQLRFSLMPVGAQEDPLCGFSSLWFSSWRDAPPCLQIQGWPMHLREMMPFHSLSTQSNPFISNPYSLINPRVWSKVNHYTHTPVNAVWLVVCLSCLLVCVGIGSTETVVSIFNITAPALDLSYIAVIIAFLIYRNRVQFTRGPFHNGRYGVYINIVAIAWVSFISVVLFFPTVRPVTAANMWVLHAVYFGAQNNQWLTYARNYAICVAALIALFSLSWWLMGARQ